MYCTSLTAIDIPGSVTFIGPFAFQNCSSLASLTVSAGNPVYDSREGCNAIIETETNTLVAGCKSTVIPGSVTTIAMGAFTGLSSLISIDIPSSVTSIGVRAFEGCSSLTTVVCRADEVPYCEFDAFREMDKATLYVPASAIEAYKAATPWSSFGNILPLEDYETGIDTPTSTSDSDAGPEPYYTPGGQRVITPVRGHIYIRGGRKVIFR